MKSARAVAVALLALLLANRDAPADHPAVAFGSEASGPVNTIAAAALPAGTLALGLRNEYIERDDFSTARLARLSGQGVAGVHAVDLINSASLSMAYGLTGNVTLSVRLPWVTRSGIRETAVAHGHDDDHGHGGAAAGAASLGSASGLGDLTVLASWNGLVRGALDGALQLGFKAPTGDTGERHDGTRLETELQPGAGAWDLLAGAALSWQLEPLGLHANVLLDLTGEGAQQTELGDALAYNLAAVYPLSADARHAHGAATPSHRHWRWDLALELNGETRWKTDVGGVGEPHSGATVVYLSPGLRAAYGKLGAFVSVGYPIVDDSRGVQTGVGFRVVSGVSVVF